MILLLFVPANANKSGGQVWRQLPAPGCWRPPWACKTPILPNHFRKDYPSDSWPNRWQIVGTATNDLPAIVQRLAVHLPSICKRFCHRFTVDLPTIYQQLAVDLPTICCRFANRRYFDASNIILKAFSFISPLVFIFFPKMCDIFHLRPN